MIQFLSHICLSSCPFLLSDFGLLHSTVYIMFRKTRLFMRIEPRFQTHKNGDLAHKTESSSKLASRKLIPGSWRIRVWSETNEELQRESWEIFLFCIFAVRACTSARDFLDPTFFSYFSTHHWSIVLVQKLVFLLLLRLPTIYFLCSVCLFGGDTDQKV